MLRCLASHSHSFASVSLPHVSRKWSSSLVAVLQERGLIKNVTSPHLETVAEKTQVALYCGVDPTASSLHVGNLLTLIPVLHFYIRGHNAFALVGGATGKVGDPAGKNAERERLASGIIQRNVSSLSAQLGRFFANGAAYAETRGYRPENFGEMRVVNNADWYATLNFMDFMNDVGRNVRISSMLARDSVKNRLSGDGMSFGEFSYQLLQAYDFWQLHQAHGVNLQIGGSDQYGNITAGIDLISRLQQQQSGEDPGKQEVFGLTVPLLTTPSGEKFGKSAGNAIWLDADLTSAFDLYQYFLRTPDSHLEAYLKLFTFRTLDEIGTVMHKHNEQASKRMANRMLAEDLVVLVHGSEAFDKVNLANRILFPGDFEASPRPLQADEILRAFTGDVSVRRIPKSEMIGERVVVLLRKCQVAKSGKEAHQLIHGGGLYLGDTKITDTKDVVREDWLIDGRVLLLRIGKNRFTIVEAS